ncbi:MAG TPA: phytanoyl-CoA dioxygenase family protein [Puia sp.]|nr:phytanoyl-CoA dioxygenase family protein [Puia sp.]
MDLKKFKPVHWVYNLIHYQSVKHNKEAYKKFHLNKPLIASISSKDFPDRTSRAWLDISDSRAVASKKPLFHSFPEPVQKKILDWSDNGYLILEKLFTNEECDHINAEIDRLQKHGDLTFNNSNKLMFANRKSKLIKSVTNTPLLKSVLEFLLDKEVVAFQTINFLRGSEQRAHSDSIHMTTYPLGYLIAAWIALEDITDENGPLFYYPGSHQLPYLLNNDFNEGETPLTLGKKNYSDYEDRIDDILKESPFKKQVFRARKGDTLIWHANLVHGGMPILNPATTRKSMVIHYYATDVIKYHEITERPSLIQE